MINAGSGATAAAEASRAGEFLFVRGSALGGGGGRGTALERALLALGVERRGRRLHFGGCVAMSRGEKALARCGERFVVELLAIAVRVLDVEEGEAVFDCDGLALADEESLETGGIVDEKFGDLVADMRFGRLVCRSSCARVNKKVGD